MKKILVALLLVTFLIGLIFAANQNGKGIDANPGNSISQTKTQTGKYLSENNKEIQVQEKENNQFKLKTGNYSADCDCNLTSEKIQNKTKFYAKLSNGKNAEIKIMPDTASETALARLRMKVCSEERNCTIQLKEVGKDENKTLAYEIKAKKQSKFFGLFKKQMLVEAEVSAENGEIIQTKKPWWAFLASEPNQV